MTTTALASTRVTTWWRPSADGRALTDAEIPSIVQSPHIPVHIVETARGLGVAVGGTLGSTPTHEGLAAIGALPALHPESLGDRSFIDAHRVRFPYVAGEMANGIASTRMIESMARAGMLGFFGAAGLAPDRVERATAYLRSTLPDGAPWGVNLIHSPNEPAAEEAVAELLLRHGVPSISASAFMSLTLAVVRCSAAGLRPDRDGRIVRRTRVFAKVSRPEVARAFMAPAPAELLDALRGRGQLTEDEARLAARVPVAEDVTVEADSGGHTDNRPLVAMLPVILRLRDELVRRHGYRVPIRIGAAGGLGTPHGVAAAFALGAAYVVTGSVNQVAAEAGVCAEAKAMLAAADAADVMMAPAADMFELGVKVQVLKRGTMFAGRAQKLYEIYRSHPSLEAVPGEVLARLEREVLRASIAEIWRQTQEFWRTRDPCQLRRAARDPKHRMALVFRWYLGQSSRWAITGDDYRRTDYQLWCGPAMGAFNDWTAGGFLAEPDRRTVVQIALNLMEGAAVITRAHQLRAYGIPVPASAFSYLPRPLT